MRFYPRNQKSRDDAQLGPGHIGNHGRADMKTMLDRQLRYEPAKVAANIKAEYGGSA